MKAPLSKLFKKAFNNPVERKKLEDYWSGTTQEVVVEIDGKRYRVSDEPSTDKSASLPRRKRYA